MELEVVLTSDHRNWRGKDTIKTEYLKKGVVEDINFSNNDNLKINIFSEEIESNSFIKLLQNLYFNSLIVQTKIVPFFTI